MTALAVSAMHANGGGGAMTSNDAKFVLALICVGVLGAIFGRLLGKYRAYLHHKKGRSHWTTPDPITHTIVGGMLGVVCLILSMLVVVAFF